MCACEKIVFTKCEIFGQEFTLNYRKKGEHIESNNEKLRSYFLGQLSAPQNDSFEEEIALDEDLFEQARLAERELIDDYVRRNLSESDALAFEANYVNSERRREKVISSASLWRVANEQQTKVLAPSSDFSKSLWDVLTNWKFITGFAATLIIFGVVFMELKSGGLSVEVAQCPERSAGPLVKLDRTEEPAPDTNQLASPVSESANVNVLNVNIAKASPKRPTSTAPLPSSIATFTLLPGALRDEGEQAIQVPPNAKTVDLRLTPTKDAPKYPAYSVIIKTADGETIFTAPNSPSPLVRVPAKKLQNRTYIAFLQGLTNSNTSEAVAEYTFRVRR